MAKINKAYEAAKRELVTEFKKSAYALFGSINGYSKQSVMSQSTLSRRMENPDELTLREIRALRNDLRIDKDLLLSKIGAII